MRPFRRNPADIQMIKIPTCSIAALLLLLAASGCASAPPAPEAALQAAQQSIAAAERSDAGQFAPGDLGDARTRLGSANKAVQGKQMVLAQQLAVESRAAAELATAKTAAAKAATVNADMVRSNAALLDEMNRKTGVTP